MNLLIRPATLSDVDILADYNARMAIETEDKRLEASVLRNGVREVLTSTAHGVYYVAEVDGAVVGQLLLTYEWSDWRNGQFWWIQSVYVDEAWRGKKIFTALYEHIREKAQEDPSVCGLRLYVESENERAQATYAALGMRKTPYRMFEEDFTRERNV
jgi:ribosomal protein S18 acetylase RimI-like enzyme